MSPASSNSGLNSQQMNGAASGTTAGSSQGQLMTVTLAASANDHVFEASDGSDLTNAPANYS